MSYATIRNYNLSTRLPNDGDGEIPYNVLSDGLAHDEKDDEDFLYTIRDCRRQGILPIVTVHVPQEHTSRGVKR